MAYKKWYWKMNENTGQNKNVSMMKSLFFIFLIFTPSLYFTQALGVKRAEGLIMNKYDSIQYCDITLTGNSERLKKLVDQSKKLKYAPGILRGLILLQLHATKQGDYELSEKYGNQAEKMASEENDYNSLGLITINNANTAIGLGMLSEAKEMIYRNKPNADKIPNKADKARYFANSYMMLSGVYSRMKKTDSLIYYAKKSLEVMKTVPIQDLTDLQKTKYYHLYIFQLMNMGIICLERKTPPDPVLAEAYIQRALKFSETHPQYFKLCDIEVYETASYIYLKREQYEKSIFFAQKALEIEKTKRKPEERLALYNDLKEAYKVLKNETGELKYLNLYTKLSDSLNKSQKNTVVNQSRKEIKKIKTETQNQYSRTTLEIGLAAIVSILIIIALSWIYNKRKNNEYLKKNDELIAKLKNKNWEKELPVEKKPTTYNNTIYSETEKKLLKKLKAFEGSGKFLRSETSLNYLASQFKTNATYLSQIINYHKNQNFNNYINSLRINYITNKLYNERKYREYKISYLAEECGYSSPQVFVNAFKNEHGVTPSYFIEQLKRQPLEA
ncbi:AraC family transcriptional regulator [Chryseobacterium daecheongense]|uniref:helix-turn-helix domain-containing protein n=1 Tax=Chryseobacterium daecheongense TaxID=192389 RepID=UPI001FD6419C|nr:AraC family transcriptional regulator [Chryseobacterium daecheongense]UOU99897.1 AraC family transcriptional regulator [Chryseobacterium daecheongense]